MGEPLDLSRHAFHSQQKIFLGPFQFSLPSETCGSSASLSAYLCYTLTRSQLVRRGSYMPITTASLSFLVLLLP